MKRLFLAMALMMVPLAQALGAGCSTDEYIVARALIMDATDRGLIMPDPSSAYDGITISVIISESFWDGMNFLAKSDFASSLVCAMAGVDKGILKLDFRSDKTGKVIGKWFIDRLMVEGNGGGTRVQ